ncbi:hypothetical protein Pla52o_49500 [Novipirellula galeiformis]|uniref:Uncharacterized protein n=1 Tax=Novipirellula galeiformis TaxID=2528004 RepID=A0A5C6C0L3_9BACT|nr:hypothetical protein Pla52o_49500 [Novipirellula galeiformis]
MVVGIRLAPSQILLHAFLRFGNLILCETEIFCYLGRSMLVKQVFSGTGR